MSLPMRARTSLPRLLLTPRSTPSHAFSTSRAAFTTPTAASTSAESSSLDWSTYLQLRRSKRWFGLIASVPTTIAGFSIGAGYFATIEAEPNELILGMEPIYVLAAATFGCVGLGWLSGPMVGTSVWKMTHRNVLREMEAKDREFYHHIVRNRVDPSRQSLSNPVPDYYCEKVGNLKQYRQWLRDQNAYRRKSQFGEDSEKVL